MQTSDPHQRFGRALLRRRCATAIRRLTGREPQVLRIVDDITGWASRAPRCALGVQPIPLESITGTVEPVKARHFDAAFRPDAVTRHRWQTLWTLQASGIALPPIVVYRIGEEHVVIDGHHRVSVAIDQGLAMIDADVVELRGRGAA